jgi:hypothetical protein
LVNQELGRYQNQSWFRKMSLAETKFFSLYLSEVFILYNGILQQTQKDQKKENKVPERIEKQHQHTNEFSLV